MRIEIGDSGHSNPGIALVNILSAAFETRSGWPSAKAKPAEFESAGFC
jgi:hypothetical protein